MGEVLLAAAAGTLLWIGAMGFGRSLLAQDEPAQRGAQGESKKPAFSPAVEQKLDQALQNDEVILSRFDAIMQEMQVVKVRALRHPQTPRP